MQIPVKNCDGFLEGNLILEKWNMYWGKDLDLKLNIGGDMVVERADGIHEKGYAYLIENQSLILNSILDEVSLRYSELIKRYNYQKGSELKDIIVPETIFIMDVHREGMSYIGYEFSCAWEEEHDLGLMLHGTRVVAYGQGDTAFLSWIAEEDQGK